MGIAEMGGFFLEKKNPFSHFSFKDIVARVFLATQDVLSETFKPNIERKPLKVYENVDLIDGYVQSEHFASKEEVRGFLSGSEGWVLCSKGESIYSHSFVQCSAALIRNRNTGLITLIHQSTWSDAADAALMLQRRDDIDVITISGPLGSMQFKNVNYTHYKNPHETANMLEKVDVAKSREYQQSGAENKVHLMRRSALLGLSEDEVKTMSAGVLEDDTVGMANHVGKIDIPLAGGDIDRWFLLYRPQENCIWIYESKSKKLFKYRGFSPIKK